jgi:hypothetical protein
VEELLILETTFLVDLERELARGDEGPAQSFLERNPEAKLCVTFTIAGEVAQQPSRACNVGETCLRSASSAGLAR